MITCSITSLLQDVILHQYYLSVEKVLILPVWTRCAVQCTWTDKCQNLMSLLLSLTSLFYVRGAEETNSGASAMAVNPRTSNPKDFLAQRGHTHAQKQATAAPYYTECLSSWWAFDMTHSNSAFIETGPMGRQGCACCAWGCRQGSWCPAALMCACRGVQIQGMHMVCWLRVPALILLAPKLCPAVDANVILLGANGVRHLTHLFPLCRWKPYVSQLSQCASI